MTEDQVFGVVKSMNDQMLAAGYRATKIPDSRIFVYNPNGGAIEVIWSRQDGQGREVQRLVVHFQCARIDGAWRFTAIHSRLSDAERDHGSLDKAWAL
jgi:hypothetical protein